MATSGSPVPASYLSEFPVITSKAYQPRYAPLTGKTTPREAGEAGHSHPQWRSISPTPQHSTGLTSQLEGATLVSHSQEHVAIDPPKDMAASQFALTKVKNLLETAVANYQQSSADTVASGAVFAENMPGLDELQVELQTLLGYIQQLNMEQNLTIEWVNEALNHTNYFENLFRQVLWAHLSETAQQKARLHQLQLNAGCGRTPAVAISERG